MDAVHSIDQLLVSIEALHASDLHVAAGSPPLVRVNGVLSPLDEAPELTAE
jgi:Tfp pilus assembly pilus retraction ATPase PilT